MYIYIYIYIYISYNINIYTYVNIVYLYISQSFKVVNLANFADTKSCLTLLAKVESIR